MKGNIHISVFGTFLLCFFLLPNVGEGWGKKKEKIKIACIGDSITFGARLENRDKYSYPAQLQVFLGDNYSVENFGVGGCTLIRKGKPNVWTQLAKIKESHPDIVIISLGTNDTCGGTRKCWDHKNDYPDDYRDLIDKLRTFPSKPQIYICAPSPMVIETPGLDSARIADLQERQPRLQELITIVKKIAVEKNTNFIDLNTPMASKPELFTENDGVHPNKAGYLFIADLVYGAIRKLNDKKAYIKSEKSNAILFITNNLSGGDMAAYDNLFIETPNMDKSLDQDVWPEYIHVCPNCPPTRAELMTGKNNHRVGVWHTFPGRGRKHKSELTIAKTYTNSG